MSKTYKKVHQSEKALKSHKAKLKERGAVIEQEYLGYGHKLKYHFPKKG
jgi:hypothetical protein